MVVGNKQDVVREIEPGDVQDWAQNFLPQERYTHQLDLFQYAARPIQPFWAHFFALGSSKSEGAR